MAYDKIIPITRRLDHCMGYVLNEEKTDLALVRTYIGDEAKTCLPDSGTRLETAINCQLDTALQDMLDTKRRWDKTGGVQAYHLIHSYAPGEVTPVQAHELGVEFAGRLLGERYEVVVSTHLDHSHLHCHILFNSVSFVDGKKFQNKFRDYFRDIRGVSNAVSMEHGLSVIQPEGGGKHYAEWQAERTGKNTVRGVVRQDIDAAISRSFTYQSFWELLEKMGYTVKRGPNVKHPAVRPPGGVRFIRLSSLGDGYTEEAVRERLAQARSGQSSIKTMRTSKPLRRYTAKSGALPHRPRQKLKGFRALYVHYLYLLGVRKPSRKRPPLPFSVRKDVVRLNRYVEQFRFLQAYRIDNAAQLAMLFDALQAEIDALTDQRNGLYRLKRRGRDVDGEIQAITQKLRPLRQKLKACGQIEQSVRHIRSQAELCGDARGRENEHQKTTVKTREARPPKFSLSDR